MPPIPPRNIIVILLLAVLAFAGCTVEGTADWQALREEANELYGQQRYEEAIKGYERAMAAADKKDAAEARLQLRQDIIDCHQALGNQTKVREKKGKWTDSELTAKYQMAEAEAALGHGDEAFRLLKESYEINDTLLARQAEENAQELEAVYQNQLKTEQISRQRLWIIILGGIVAVLTVLLLVYRIQAVRQRKNKAIVDVVRNMTQLETTADDAPAEDAETSRFAAFDRTVEQGRLYTQSDLSREMLADLMGVDRTTFSRIIQEQSGCKNLKDYLNQKRMRHAEQLLRQHPDYTIEAIASDCGLTLTTFKRLCKDMHGLSPSDYRKSLLQ